MFVTSLWSLRLRVPSFWPFVTSSGVRFLSLPPGHFLAVLLFRNFLVVIASIRHFLLLLRLFILPPQPPRRTFSGSAIRGPFFVFPAKLTLQVWVIQTSLLQRTEADRQRIVFLHFILNAMRPTDTSVQLVARSQGSRGGCSFCFQSYRDREFIASGPRSCLVLEHDLEDDVLRAWMSTEKYTAIAALHASGAYTNRCASSP